MEKVVDQLEHQNGKFKLEMRKIIHEKALGQVLALTGKWDAVIFGYRL